MKTIHCSSTVCAILLVIAISITSSSWLLAQNSFSLYSSGNTGNFMKFKTKTISSTTRGYVGLNYTKPFQMLQLTGGNILLTRGAGNPSCTNGAILFGGLPDSVNSLHGEWGIEYETHSGELTQIGGLNLWKCPSSLNQYPINYVLFLKNNGNIGIGNGDPATKLHVTGDVTVSTLANSGNYIVSSDANGKLVLFSKQSVDNLGNHIATQNLILGDYTIQGVSGHETKKSPTDEVWLQGLKFLNNTSGNMRLASFSDASFHLDNLIGSGENPSNAIYWASNSRCGGVGFGLTNQSKGGIFWDAGNPQSIMTFVGTKVGIGCDPGNSKHRLFVKDGIVAEEVLVKLQGQWSDYVFNADYDLMSLDKLSDFITKNQHLPDIPTAKEVDDNGLNVGEMNALLLKKVEELTLYIIDQQKQLDELKIKLENQQNNN